MAVKQTNWTPELEALGRDEVTGEDYIIDVLATPPRDERRSAHEQRAPWAYEVQFTKQTSAVADRRTQQRKRGHLAQVCWMNMAQVPDPYEFPSVLLSDVDQWTVRDGVFREAFLPADPMPMDELIRRFHRDDYWWVQGIGYLDKRASQLGSRSELAEEVERRRKRKRRRVDDRCDRPEASALASVPRPPHPSVDWGDDEWRRFASMAHARKVGGVMLDFQDLEAISRFPMPPPTWGAQ